MTELASRPPARPARTWRPMVLWSVGIVLALGLVWFSSAVVVPFVRLHALVEDCANYRTACLASYLIPEEIANPERDARILGAYLSFPKSMNPNRGATAYLLAFCGRYGVEPLTKALNDADPEVRSTAASSLASIGPEARGAVPVLRRLLTGTDYQMRRSAAIALGGIGREAAPAIPELVTCLDHEDSELRGKAARALGTMGAAAEDAVPKLTVLLRDSEWTLRWAAVDALAGIGPAAKPAAPALVVALVDSKVIVRRRAARALAMIAPETPNLLASLIEGLQDAGCGGGQEDSAEALTKLGSLASQAKGPLVAALRSHSPVIRRYAAISLGNLGADAASATPALEVLLRDDDEYVRNVAAEALKKIRGEEPPK